MRGVRASPTETEITYKIITMKMFCLMLLLFLNKTMIPTPLPMLSPAIVADRVIPPSIKSSIKKTDAAQFGITPIMEVTSGWRYLFIETKFINLSIPT